jgi:GTP 3',8-cyclase
MASLQDNYGRRFYYLRLSITDMCNFYCGYCLPNGYQKKQRDFLDLDEIRRLVTGFVELGVQKIRLTGGEPTIRKDFCEIAKTLSQLPGVKKLALTTNGYHLEQNITEYKQAGIDNITVSIDSLIPEKFHKITRHDCLKNILSGIMVAQQLNFNAIKINAVLLNNINIDEIDAFIEMARHNKLSIRFIELMQTGSNIDYFRAHHISSDCVREKLDHQGWKILERERDAGPAIEYHHPDYMGKIGIIAPYGKGFCATCNRLRVSAKGELCLCLFDAQGYSLRHLLQDDQQLSELIAFITAKLPNKHESHYLLQGNTGMNRNFAAIGG